MTSGINYLLDTNYILGLLKATSKAVKDAEHRNLKLAHCGYSTITRMELLGYPGISMEESALISQRLSKLHYYPLTELIEHRTILLRQSCRIKLPDAIIAATALEQGLELLTFDRQLSEFMGRNAR